MKSGYEDRIRLNIEERIKIIERCEKDRELQEVIKEICRRDKKFFIEKFCWTYDPRKEIKDIPFILYEYQVELINWLDERKARGEDGLIEKSRDMGVTWVGSVWFLWHFLFEKGFLGLMGSRKEDLVDRSGDITTLFERIRYNLYRLPVWLMPKGFKRREHDKYMRIMNPENGSSIIGESTNEEFGRQARASVAWLDEFASWQHSEEAWASVSQVTPVKIVVSTPKGKRNTFARLRFESKIKIFTLHWSRHPEKDESWYKKIKEEGIMTRQEIAQELDINYIQSSGEPVYPDFRKDKHVGEFKVNPEKVIYRGWDFGYHHPAVVFCQFDDNDRLIVIDEVMGEDEILEVFAKEKVLKRYEGHKGGFIDYCDPAGAQKSDRDGKTSIEVLNGIGIYPRWRKSNIELGLTLIRKMLIEDIGGKPALMIDKRCRILIEGFEGGYHYREGDDSGIPEKDGWYEHLQDALRYVVVNVKRLYPVKKKLKRREWRGREYSKW